MTQGQGWREAGLREAPEVKAGILEVVGWRLAPKHHMGLVDTPAVPKYFRRIPQGVS